MTARMRLAAALLVLPMLLTACVDQEARRQEQARALALANEQAAGDAVADFDASVADENWVLARAQAEILMARWPETEVAERVGQQYEEIRALADAAREQARVAALWSYNIEHVNGGQQLSAAIFSKDDVDTDGHGARPVRWIFRDHPSWGRSSYLVLQAGDFDCYGSCRVQVAVDDQAPRSMAAHRPVTDEAIAMFIDDERTLWRLTDGATRIGIEFPVKAGGRRTVVFEVAGLDRSSLPGWN